MFDPTAFDNIKVVLEGALYDRDLDGEIFIFDRNDFVNLAKMSRTFELYLRLLGEEGSPEAKLMLSASMENLAAEIISNSSEALAGCHIKLVFWQDQEHTKEHFNTINDMLKEIWGDERIISQRVHYNPFSDVGIIKNEMTVEFERIVREEQMEDLIDLIDYVIITLKRLKNTEES